MHRFYVPGFPPSGEVQLPEDEAQHLSRVLRMQSGDAVAIFDGAGREALARVSAIAGQRVTVNVAEPRTPAAEPRVAVTLGQALLKSDKMDRVIRDVVMLGAAAVQPLATRRADVPLSAVARGGRQDRWERTVVASVKQCGRAVVPPVFPARTFEDAIREWSGKPMLMFVEPGTAAAVSDISSVDREPPASGALVLVGPEGGWDAGEVRAASAAGATLLSFGTRVLRADAAGAVVVSVLRYIWRDL